MACCRTAQRGIWARSSGTRSATRQPRPPVGRGSACATRTPTTAMAVPSQPGRRTPRAAIPLPTCPFPPPSWRLHRRRSSRPAPRSYRDTVLSTTGLAGYWRLGEQSGTAAADETRTSAGSYQGGYTLGGPSALARDSNTSVGFDGVSGEMKTSGPALASSASIEGWFNWQSGVALMRDGTSNGRTGWILAYDRGGYLYYRLGG